MANPIVVASISVTQAPTPATLQQTGAMISQGGTNTSPGTLSLLTQLSDLTPLLHAPSAITSLTWTSNVVTATTSAAHNLPNGETINLTIAGAVPAGYSGTFPCTITGTTTFTYPLLTNPGTETTPGTWNPASANVITQMATTYFAQPVGVAVYLLECGVGNVNDGVAFLNAYLTANPNSQYVAGAFGYNYAYLIPRIWDGNTNFLTMLSNYNAPTAQTYFFVTTNLANYTLYSNLDKCVVALIEAPSIGVYAANVLTALSYTTGVITATTTTAHGVLPGQWFQLAGNLPSGYNGWWLAQPGTTGSTLVANSLVALGAESQLGTLVANYVASSGVNSTEFSHAADFFVALNYNPNGLSQVTPFEYSYLYGVTPFPTRNMSALLTTIKAANVSYVGTGAEGGISNTILVGGNTLDGNSFNIWYAIDWVVINTNLQISNAVINGSNNPANPLYYNQDGINQLQLVAANVMTQGVSYGLVVFPPVQTELTGSAFAAAINAGTYNGFSPVNAVPFLAYAAANPSAYKIGQYGGIAISFVPQRGFDKIVVNINASEIIAAA